MQVHRENTIFLDIMTPQAQRLNNGVSKKPSHGDCLKHSDILGRPFNLFLFSHQIGNLIGIQRAEGERNVLIHVAVPNGSDCVSEGLGAATVGGDADEIGLEVLDVLADDLVVGEFLEFLVVDEGDLER
jgi:hypothetical protein